MGSNKQANKMVASSHGPAYFPINKYGLSTINMMTSMNMLKRSDVWIADSGDSNHVTFSDKGCLNKRDTTGLTHGIVGKSVHPQCELDIPCVHYNKDGNQVGEVMITDISCLSEGSFNLFTSTSCRKRDGPSLAMPNTSSLLKEGTDCCSL